MTKPITTSTVIELENMVDAYGLTAILESLAGIAHDKALHIQLNWQDEKTAKTWDVVASKLWSAATTAETYVGR